MQRFRFAKEEVVGSLGTLMGVEGDALEMVEEGDYEGNYAYTFIQERNSAFSAFIEGET